MKSFKISCWNIQGLHSSTFGNKSADQDLLSSVTDMDICIFHETWCRSNEALHCPIGYKEMIVPSLKKSQIKYGRDSGGILIWHKDNLKHLIKIVKIENASIWLEVKSVISQHNLYLCALYIPPHDSPYYNEQSFLQLQTDILHFQSRGQVLICGDLNARTGREIDYVNIVDNNHISNDTTFHSSLVITPRNSYDSLVNTNGKQVLKLCKGLGLYIINGRTRGDSLGRFTYCSRLGASVVDYSITDIDPNFINAFIVRPQLPISDHCQTVLYLNQSIDRVSTAPLKHEKLFPLKPKLRWNQSNAEQFKENMSNSVILNMLDHFMSTDFTPDTNGINAATSNLIHIFQTLANISNSKPPNKHRTNKQKIKRICGLIMNALVSEKTFDNFLTKSIKNRPIRRYGSPTPTV